MAFGISGSDTCIDMVGTDVAVTWINDYGPNAVDYYLTDKQQFKLYCSVGFIVFYTCLYSVEVGLGCVLSDTLLASGSGTQLEIHP